MSNYEKLRKEIKSKFSSVAKFADETGEDRYELQKLFSRGGKLKTLHPEKEKEFDRLLEVCTSHGQNEKGMLSDDLRAKIIAAIKSVRVRKTIYNKTTDEEISTTDEDITISEFCKEYEQFPKQQIAMILRGELPKNRTGVVNQLIKLFGIE